MAAACSDNDSFLAPLDALLDDFVACWDADESRDATPGGREPATAAAGTPPWPAKQLAGPKKRVSKKTELEALRAEAAALEAELVRERECWKRQSTAMVAARGRRHADVWNPIARRQREALDESEALNRELRRRLQLQRKQVQRVRKLLAKRASILATCGVPPPSSRLLAPECTLVFHKLLRGSVQMLHSVGAVQSRFQALDQPVFRQWVVSESSVSAVDCHVVPYDLEYVCRVVSNLTEGRTTQRHQAVEFFQASESTVARQFLSSISTQGETGVIRVNQVVRSFVSDAQTVFVIDTLVGRLAESGETYRHVRSKKWIIISARSEASEAPVTSIQCYYEFMPDEAEVAYKQLWRQSKIREVLIPTLDTSATKTNQELENALVDEVKSTR